MLCEVYYFTKLYLFSSNTHPIKDDKIVEMDVDDPAMDDERCLSIINAPVYDDE